MSPDADSDEGGTRGASAGGDCRTDGNGEVEDATESTLVQTVVILISAALTVLLFAYAGWQIALAPQADVPEVSVVGTEQLADGSVAVRVQLETPQDAGLVSATIESNCASPPVQVQVNYVPPSSSRTATLVCPPGTTDPGASLVNWVTR